MAAAAAGWCGGGAAWCTGHGSPSQVGAATVEAAMEGAAVSMGTECTERTDPLGAMISCCGAAAMGPMGPAVATIWGWKAWYEMGTA